MEGRITSPEFRRFSGALSFTHYSELVTPPFTGGLFIGSTAIDPLSSRPFVIDLGQNLGIQGTVTYRPRPRLWASVSTRYAAALWVRPSGGHPNDKI